MQLDYKKLRKVILSSTHSRDLVPTLLNDLYLSDLEHNNTEEWFCDFGKAWRDCADIYQYEDGIKTSLLGMEKYWKFMMNKDEQHIYDTLPQSLNIYRLNSKPSEKPILGWTLSKGDAKKVAKEWNSNGQGISVSCKIQKNQVIALKTNLVKHEFIVDLGNSTIHEDCRMWTKFLRKG